MLQAKLKRMAGSCILSVMDSITQCNPEHPIHKDRGGGGGKERRKLLFASWHCTISGVAVVMCMLVCLVTRIHKRFFKKKLLWTFSVFQVPSFKTIALGKCWSPKSKCRHINYVYVTCYNIDETGSREVFIQLLACLHSSFFVMPI